MRQFRLICALGLLALLCGCSNYAELNDLEIVAGIALDKEAGEYLITLEMLDLEGSQQPSEMKAHRFSVRGETIPKALDSAKTQFSRQLHFGNLQVLVLGQQVAREESIRDLLDWFLRDIDIRETVRLVVSREATAAALMETSGADFPVASYAIEHIINPTNAQYAHTKDSTLYCVANALDSPGVTLMLPAVKLRVDNGETHVDINGLAAFSGDRLTFFLEQEHLPFFLYLVNKVSMHEHIFPYEGQWATLYISHSETGFRFKQTGQRVLFSLDIKAISALDQAPPGLDMTDTATIAALEQAASAQLREDLLQTLAAIQETGLDMAGFGHRIYLRDEALWEALSGDGQPIGPRLDFEVTVSIAIKSTGSIRRS